MKTITPAQQRKIYACARECGMDNDLLHLVIKNITGYSSLKELTAMEACLVIDTMEGRQDNDSVKDAATPKQMCYIKDLMKQLGWVNEKSEPDMARLDGMCKKYAKVESHKWLSRTGASSLIEAFKKMLERQRVQRAE